MAAADYTSEATKKAALGTFYKEVFTELDGCRQRASELGLVTHASRGLQLSIAGVGILAGSIIVPALAAKAVVAKSTVAAWGGVAGAANAAQASITTAGYSAEQAVAAQKDFQTKLQGKMDRLKDAKTGEERAAYLLELRLVCQVTLPFKDSAPLSPAEDPK